MQIANLAGYRFVTLEDREALKTRLEAGLRPLGVVGTILLAPEGINVFLAGTDPAARAALAVLDTDPRLAGLEVKWSRSDTLPFRRLRVRLKKEIITMKMPLVCPEAGRAPAVEPATLKRWLDQGYDDMGRQVVLLDTRNDYEVAVGSFAGALDFGVRVFSAFPAAVAAHREALAGKTVVSFCTGGIRCEKAALYMQRLGLDARQLEGGILKYFEEVGGAHFRGDCFVFDDRGAVDAGLEPVRGA